MSQKAPTIRRAHFLRAISKRGYTTAQAEEVYDVFMEVIEDGICNGCIIGLRHCGTIRPVKRGPRVVVQNCMKGPGQKTVRVRREIVLGSRLCYVFRMFKKFRETRQLKWRLF